MISAPVRCDASFTAAANAGVSGRTPPSPWIGSRMMAAVLLVTASRTACGLLALIHFTPGISGSNGVR